PDVDTVLLPVGLAVAGVETDLARRETFRCLTNIGAQGLFRSGLVGMSRRVDITDATARIEPDVPGPTRCVRGRDRVGGNWRVRPLVRHLHRESRIAEQNRATGLVGHTQAAADQLRTKSGAIYKQIPGQQTMLARHQRSY